MGSEESNIPEVLEYQDPMGSEESNIPEVQKYQDPMGSEESKIYLKCRSINSNRF